MLNMRGKRADISTIAIISRVHRRIRNKSLLCSKRTRWKGGSFEGGAIKGSPDRPFVAMMNFVIPLKQGKSAAMLWANLYYARIGLQVVILFNSCGVRGEEAFLPRSRCSFR